MYFIVLCSLFHVIYGNFVTWIPEIPHESYKLPPPSPVWNYPQNETSNKIRRNIIKEAFLHSWNAYKKYAWGHDELNPISKTPNDWLGGLSQSFVSFLHI